MEQEKRYLDEIHHQIEIGIQKLHALSRAEDTPERVAEILKEIVISEHMFRSNLHIGVRFDILEKQLQALLERYQHIIDQQNLKLTQGKKNNEAKLSAEERLVYVYLFNSQGLILSSWQKLLTDNALVEHSVNRPVYVEKSAIDALLRTKPHSANHGYIAVAIHKDNIYESNKQHQEIKDQEGCTLLRLKRGALKLDKVQYFFHEGKFYSVSKEGLQLSQNIPVL